MVREDCIATDYERNRTDGSHIGTTSSHDCCRSRPRSCNMMRLINRYFLLHGLQTYALQFETFFATTAQGTWICPARRRTQTIGRQCKQLSAWAVALRANKQFRPKVIRVKPQVQCCSLFVRNGAAGLRPPDLAHSSLHENNMNGDPGICERARFPCCTSNRQNVVDVYQIASCPSKQ